MKPIALTAIAALLGACSSATSTPPLVVAPVPFTPPVINPVSTQGSARVNGNQVTVVQYGKTFPIQITGGVSGNGLALREGYVPPASPLRSSAYAKVNYITISGTRRYLLIAAAGEYRGTYFAGLTGTKTTGMATSGTLNLTGMYGLNDNGTTASSLISLTADLAAGTLTGSTANVNVNATINGASVTGTLDHLGHSSTLTGGFYGNAAAPTMASTFLGNNLAGVLVVN